MKSRVTPRIPVRATMNSTGQQHALVRYPRPSDPTRDSLVVPPVVHDVLRAPGEPPDRQTRAFMEPRFGRDFSHVRMHTNAQAADSAMSVNALGYTVGHHLRVSQEVKGQGGKKVRGLKVCVPNKGEICP